MLVGLLIGYLCRRIPNLSFTKKLPSYLVYVLLFTLGIAVGADKEIISNILSVGGEALLVAFAAVMGSVLMAYLLYIKVFNKKEVSNKKNME